MPALTSVVKDEPLFVAPHIPLHSQSNRTIGRVGFVSGDSRFGIDGQRFFDRLEASLKGVVK